MDVDYATDSWGFPLEKIDPAKPFTLQTHADSACASEPYPCWIHSPSDHRMRAWPTLWRADTQVLERLCEHGVGHPDPDNAALLVRIGQPWKVDHGCDGCCRPPEADLETL